MKREKGMFMGRKRAKEGYSPYYGAGEKRGPCHRAHNFRHHEPVQKTLTGAFVSTRLKCLRCGWITDRPLDGQIDQESVR